MLLVPVNFSSSSNGAAVYAANLSTQWHQPLLLLHIITIPFNYPPQPLPKEVMETLISDAETNMESLKNHLKSITNCEINTSIEMGSIGFQLEKTVRDFHPKTIILGRTQQSNHQLIFSTNVIDQLLKLNLPIVVINEGISFEPINKIAVAVNIMEEKYHIPFKLIDTYAKSLNASVELVYIQTSDKDISHRVAYYHNILHGLPYHLIIHRNDQLVQGFQAYVQEHRPQQVVAIPQHHSFFEFHSKQTPHLLSQSSLPVVVVNASAG